MSRDTLREKIARALAGVYGDGDGRVVAVDRAGADAVLAVLAENPEYEQVGTVECGYDDDAIVVRGVTPSADDWAFERHGVPAYVKRELTEPNRTCPTCGSVLSWSRLGVGPFGRLCPDAWHGLPERREGT